MYNRDKSILYYRTQNRQKFLQALKIHYATFEKHLAKGTYYLKRYLFTQVEPSAVAFAIKNLTLSELALKLEKDRIKNSKKKR